MTISITNSSKFVALAVGAGLVLAVAFGGFAAPAHAAALTSAQVSSIISLLQSFGADAQTIANVQASLTGGTPVGGGSGSAACSITRDLTIGSTGADVTCLQQALISMGYSIPAGATGYFGAQTQAAVKAWQAAKGVSPAAGFFGPISRAAWGASAGGSTGGTTGGSTGGTVVLSGAGRLSNVSGGGSVESDLKEGDASTAVVGLVGDVRGGDIVIQRVEATLTIASNNANSSASIGKYLESVDLYINGKKVASMDATDGDKDGRVWTFRFSNLSSVVKEGDEAQVYVQVTPVSSIGANEDGESITATLATDAIRAADASGISDTYGPAADEDAAFTVSTATTGELSLTENSSNPDDQLVKVDDNSTTEDVLLMVADLKAKKQDITVHDFPVQLCTSDVIGDVVQSVTLQRGSTDIKTKSVTGSGTCANVVFDNIDRDISKDDTESYNLVATFKSTNDAAAYQAGDTLVASTTGALAWDVEDAEGNSVTPTGSVTGPTLTVSTTSVSVTNVTSGTPSTGVVSVTNADPGTAGSADTKTYHLAFKVTAGDDDLFIDRSIQRTSSPSTAGAGVAWATTTDSTASSTGTATTAFTATDTNSQDTATVYKIPAGTTRTFDLAITLTATDDGYTAVQLTGVNYTTDSTDTTPDSYFTSNLDEFKTALTFMNFI